MIHILIFLFVLLKGYDAPAVKRNGAVEYLWAMVGWMNDRTEPDFFACVCKALLSYPAAPLAP